MTPMYSALRKKYTTATPTKVKARYMTLWMTSSSVTTLIAAAMVTSAKMRKNSVS